MMPRIVPLSEAVSVNPRNRDWANLPDDTEVTFIPMNAISEHSVSIVVRDVRSLINVRRGFTHFKENDVLLAKITPCMENGKAALATGLKNGIGFGSTEFHVLRPKNGLIPQYLYEKGS